MVIGNWRFAQHFSRCLFLRRDKIANHVSLVQAHNEGHEVGSPEYTSHMKELEFAKVALLDDVVKQLPGKSRIRRSGVLDKHFELSGKIKVLDKLLKKFYQEGSRVLLFSHSTQTLDLIQNYIRSKGHTFSRMDGTTPTSKRQELADNFKKDSNCFVFLLSTRAMGLGINLNVSPYTQNLIYLWRYFVKCGRKNLTILAICCIYCSRLQIRSSFVSWEGKELSR